MINRIIKMMGVAGGDIFALLFALVAAYASFTAKEPEAYVFPQLVAALMVGFCGANFIRCLMVGFAGKPMLTLTLLKKIAPGIAVIAIYLLVAEELGFYLSAALAFFALTFLYAEKRRLLPTIMITGAVIAVLYLMFSIALRVQVPREFFL